MGIESLRVGSTFGIEELGLLGSGPMESVDTITEFCARVLSATVAVFFVFNNASASLHIRSISGETTVRRGKTGISADRSVAWRIRDESRMMKISDLSERPEFHDAVERRILGVGGYLGAPVFGPHGEVLGVLAAITAIPRNWSARDQHDIAGYARMMTDQVLLRAALQTVKLMARDHAPNRIAFHA